MTLDQVIKQMSGCLKVPFYIHNVHRMRMDINNYHNHLLRQFYALQKDFGNKETERLEKAS